MAGTGTVLQLNNLYSMMCICDVHCAHLDVHCAHLDVHMCMHSGAHGKTKKISSCMLLSSTGVKIYKTEITKHFIALNFYFIFLHLHLIPFRMVLQLDEVSPTIYGEQKSRILTK